MHTDPKPDDDRQGRSDDGPLVSVVTPVYNGARYIAECGESVLGQTYENWEYTIVDNASSDRTPEIAQNFAARDSRVRHLRFDEFVDATANHNRAFEAISPGSEFCKVVQADDWLFPECLSLMVGAANRSSVGMVSAYQLRDSGVAYGGRLPYATTFFTGHEILRRTLLGLGNVTGGPTSIMLRSAFVRERRPFWQDGLRHEDTEAALWMLSRHDFAFVHQVLTFSREQPGSRHEWSANMYSQVPEDILFFLRYGKQVLSDSEYRTRLRALLRLYVSWHVRELPRVSRLSDGDFFELHRQKRAQILAEAHGDREVVVAMRLIGALLARESVHGRRHARAAV